MMGALPLADLPSWMSCCRSRTWPEDPDLWTGFLFSGNESRIAVAYKNLSR